LDSNPASDVISDLRLAPRFLEVATRGTASLERLRLGEIQARNPDLDVGKRTARIADAIFALSSRCKLFLCPFSGVWRETHKAVGSEAYWAEHEGRVCLVLQFCFITHAGADSAFAFPQEGVVLYFKSLISGPELKERISQLLSVMSSHAAALQAHLEVAPEEQSVAAAELRAPHFGHYVWNALSAWGHLLPHHGGKIDFFVSWRENRFIGPATGLYEEVSDKELLLLKDESDLVRMICERKAFVVFPKDSHVTEELTRRVAGYARRICPEGPLQSIDRLRRECQVIALFAIRIGNRAWLNQESGFVELARAIASRVGTAGFIIDGMNKDTTKGWTHSFMSLADELKLAAPIASAIGAFAPCITTLGASMAESLVASEVCDFYVAPAGSGLAKYKWLANKPGVLISNSTVLDRRNDRGWAIRVFERYRDGIVGSRFVATSAVADVEAADRPGPPHANFELDWRHILQEVEILLSEMSATSPPPSS
jgi:hypothetical protein